MSSADLPTPAAGLMPQFGLAGSFAAGASPGEGTDRFRRLADLIPQMVWVTDLEGNVEYTNLRWSEYTGAPYGDRDRGTWKLVTHPEDLERAVRAHRRALERLEEMQLEYRLRRADGVYRWHLARTIFVFDDAGKPILRFGTATDIHDQKVEHERQSFFARVSETLWRTRGLQERMDAAVRFASEFFGGWCAVYRPQEDGFIRLAAVAHPNPEEAELARELDRRYPYRMESPHPTSTVVRTGEAIFQAHIDPEEIRAKVGDPEYAELLVSLKLRSHMTLPLRTDQGTFGAIKVVSTTRNYTEADFAVAQEFARKVSWAIDNARLAEEQARNQERLQQAIRSRDEFLSIASHELRTPLTSLLLQVQMRLRRLERGETEHFAAESLKRMFTGDERQVRRLEQLIDDMLNIGHINSGKLKLTPEAFDLMEMIEDVASRFVEHSRAQGCVMTVASGVAVRGAWDRFRVEQAFTNLLANALKYGKGMPIEIGLTEEAGMAVISVRDHGPGIAPVDQQRIFNQFERAVSHTEVSGFGLGLYIVRKIIEAHRGQVGVRSELGEGSTFRIELPLV